MFTKITAFFMSMIMMLLSIFGISFKHDEGKTMELYRTNYAAKSGNEKTDELKALYKKVAERTPEIKVCDTKKPFADDDRIQAVYFDGEDYNGKPSQIFAYIGFPENADSSAPVPAMVLVHGGAGHAYAEWVQYWVNNGYAAISVDGFAQHPEDGYYTGKNEQWTVNPESHPTINETLSDSDKPFTEQWFYHYVADVILSNNIMRADSRVNKDKIGVTGISWGSMAVSTAMCYDSRFAFAIPVYGSGYLGECTGVISSLIGNSSFADVWDASNLLSEVKMPVLYINSDCDPFFSANCNTASAAYTENGTLIYAQKFLHGQNDGAYEPEILRFANEQTGMGEGNIKITEVSFNGKRAVVSFDVPEDVCNIKAYVYYRDSELDYDGLELKKDWSRKKGIDLGNVANIKVPDGAKYFYISIQGKAGKIFDKDTVQATTGIYSAEMLQKDGVYAKVIDRENLEKRIEKTLKKDIESGKVGGAQLLVNQFGERVYDGVFGMKDIDNNIPLTDDALYRIASMTKPVTAVALLMEVQKGTIDLNADVSDYLDGFKDMYVGEVVDGKVVPVKKAENSIKVYQLVSHTSGICSGTLGDALYAQVPREKRSLEYLAEFLKDKPLSFDPGTAQEYNNIGFDIAARIIEIVSGMPYDEYLKVNLFDPLGMKDTTFVPTAEQWDRMIIIHNRTEDGKAVNGSSYPGSVFSNNPVGYFMAGGGLASTAEDYSLFAEMLLNDGAGSNGVRILSEDMVALMKTPCVSDEVMPGNQKWGLGVRVITDDSYEMLPVGAFGWSGAYGTHFWIDPVNRITAVYMKNSSYEGGAGARTANEFEENVFKSLS